MRFAQNYMQMGNTEFNFKVDCIFYTILQCSNNVLNAFHHTVNSPKFEREWVDFKEVFFRKLDVIL